MRKLRLSFLLYVLAGAVAQGFAVPPIVHATPEELLITHNSVGRHGGRLVVSQHAEAKTLNPVLAVDRPSREVLGVLNADLIHINRLTHQTESALAKSWKVSRDGKQYTLQLRRGIRFSDGEPFDSQDVTFSFQVYLDERSNSSQRDLLMIEGKPIAVAALGPYAVRVTLPQPYAAGDRLFDGIAMLPRHLLEQGYREGKLGQAWPLTVTPAQIAGLGPFRVKKYTPGQQIALERNPHYWKADSKGNRLPYLDELVFLVLANEDAEAPRFEAGDTDILSPVGAKLFEVLGKDASQGSRLQDAGPGLEYNFLLFNMNDDVAGRLPEIARAQKWFKDLAFREAVSQATNREDVVRLVYLARGTALASHVTPGNRAWMDSRLQPRPASTEHARKVLASAGYGWNSEGLLHDPAGQMVEFSILVSSSNQQRTHMANLIQEDLKKLGMQVSVVPLEFRSFVQRVMQTHNYEIAVMGFASGDTDPNGEMNFWLSSGSSHLWNLGQKKPATNWEAEIDVLMQKQLTARDPKARKKLYDRVQQIVAEQLPIVVIASPHILVGSKLKLKNFEPAILAPYALHNVEELFW